MSAGDPAGARADIVAPASGRLETLSLAGVIIAILASAALAIDRRQVEDGEAPLFDWQISAFYDLNSTDQAVYNAMLAASEELWYIHGDMLTFGTEAERADPWPTVEVLDAEYLMPPFARDMAWSQQGSVRWERVASFSFEGSTVYFGSGGQAAGQSAYLLMLSHVHKGASYTNGATIWVHDDANVAAPDTVVRDSLILHGWKEVVPYSGAMEVERLKGA
jgi:hypothetical protein